jgi:ribokinase
MAKIIVLGSINVDFSVGTARFPQAGETLAGYGFAVNFGGKGANQAVSAAKCGGDVYMIGCVGSDPYGAESIKSLSGFGVKTDYVRRVPNVNTGVAVITLAEHDNTIIIDAGANAYVNAENC